MKRDAYVYVMKHADNLVKVGHSKKPEFRMKIVGGTDLLFTSELIDEVERVERTAHRLLKLSGKHVRGEYFRVSVHEAIAAIERARSIVDGRELPLEKAMPVKREKSYHFVGSYVRISAEAARILDAMAEAENRSRSNMIETLILRTSRKK